MTGIAARLAVAAVLASAATVAVATSASAATTGATGTGSARASAHGQLTLLAHGSKIAPNTVRPDSNYCYINYYNDTIVCALTTADYVEVDCYDGAYAAGYLSPGAFTIPDPCSPYDGGAVYIYY
jgi:hypothetical protein